MVVFHSEGGGGVFGERRGKEEEGRRRLENRMMCRKGRVQARGVWCHLGPHGNLLVLTGTCSRKTT